MRAIGRVTAVLNGAMIGVGFFAVNQLNAWRDLDGVEIIAICDRDPERLKLIGETFGIQRRYIDAGEMLSRERLDFVDIATTVPSHRALVELAAAHRIPVICQKPLARSLEDAKAMVAACATAGVPFMVHENFRWQSPLMAVKAHLDAGRIGAPFWARLSFRSAFDVYSGQPYLAEGRRFIIEDLGIHILDVARFLFGEVRTLYVQTQTVNPKIAGEDVATMLLTHRSGVVTMLDCSYASRLESEAFPQTAVAVDGSAGSIRLDVGYGLTVVDENGVSRHDASPPLLSWAERPWHNVQESVLNIQAHWLECLRTGRSPATSGADNLHTLELVEAAYESAATNRVITPAG